MTHSYVNPKIERKVVQVLGHSLPKPDTQEWDDLLYELRSSEDETKVALADELENNIIFSRIGDPKDAQVKAERRNQQTQNVWHSLFDRRDENGKWVWSKPKVTSLVGGLFLILFTLGFFGDRFRFWGGAEAATVTETTPEVTPIEIPEPELDVAIAEIQRPTLAPTPKAATPTPAPTPAPAPAPAPGEGENKEPATVATSGLESEPLTITRSKRETQVVLVSGERLASGSITTSQGETRPVVLTGTKRETGSSIASSRNSGAEPQVNETAQVTGGQTETLAVTGEPTLTQGSSIGGGSAPGESQTVTDSPAGPATQPTATPSDFEQALGAARQRLEAQPPTREVNYEVGETVSGSLVFGFITTGSDTLPILVLDENNVMWKGTGQLNDLARVEISLSEYLQNGQSVPKSALILDADNYPGVKATMKEEAPTIAADMIQAGLRGVTDYVNDLASNQTTLLQDQTIVIQDQVVPLEWAIAGSLTELFAPPKTTRGLVRVGQVPINTPVKIMILQ